MKTYYKQIGGQTVFFQEPLIYNFMQIYNPSEEQMEEAGWEEYTEPQPTEEELLEEAKQNKLNAIEEYNVSSNVNSFSIDGKDLWLDASLRQQLRTSIDAYIALGIESVSKWFMGFEYTFTTTQWITMLNLLEVYAADALNVTEAHKAAVSAMTDINEIESYDITSNYPTKTVF